MYKATHIHNTAKIQNIIINLLYPVSNCKYDVMDRFVLYTKYGYLWYFRENIYFKANVQ